MEPAIEKGLPPDFEETHASLSAIGHRARATAAWGFGQERRIISTFSKQLASRLPSTRSARSCTPLELPLAKRVAVTHWRRRVSAEQITHLIVVEYANLKKIKPDSRAQNTGLDIQLIQRLGSPPSASPA